MATKHLNAAGIALLLFGTLLLTGSWLIRPEVGAHEWNAEHEQRLRDAQAELKKVNTSRMSREEVQKMRQARLAEFEQPFLDAQRRRAWLRPGCFVAGILCSVIGYGLWQATRQNT